MVDIMWDVSVTAIFLFWVFGRNVWMPLMQEYKFGDEGIDLVLLRGIRLFHIKYADIREAKIVPALRARLEDPFVWNIGNRYARRVLFIRTTRGRSYMLTPAHPEDALRIIQDMIHQ